jgi:hypothetical protein
MPEFTCSPSCQSSINVTELGKETVNEAFSMEKDA